MICLCTFRVPFAAMSHLRPLRRSGWSQAGLWTKASPSIKWSKNECKGKCLLSIIALNVTVSGGSKNLKAYEKSLVQCNLCEAEVSLGRLEQHRRLRCLVCDHHHPNHGSPDSCCSCLKRCKKCGPFQPTMRLCHIQSRPRCNCGHYHAVGRTCSSHAVPSPSNPTRFSEEQHSDSDSTVQSMVI